MNRQSKERWGFMACLLFLGLLGNAFALPTDLLKALGSEDFKVRQQAQSGLLGWARLHREESLDELLKVYRGSADPEVRERCLAVLKDLLTDQYLAEGPGFLGIEWAFLQTPVPGQAEPMQAVMVTRVTPGTPANAAGILVGDLILRIDGKEWSSDPGPTEFSDEIKSRKGGSKVKFEILRDGKMIPTEVTLARRPSNLQLNGFLMPGVDVKAELQATIDAYFKEWLSERKPRE